MTARLWFLVSVPVGMALLTAAIIHHAIAGRIAAETVRAGMAEMAEACR
jgi:hypothetical protein